MGRLLGKTRGTLTPISEALVEAAKMYVAGATFQEAARAHRTHVMKVRQAVMQLGLAVRRRGPKAIQSGDTLTARERKVKALLAKGLSGMEIGRRLGISRQAVHQARMRIMVKEGSHGSTP